MSPSDYDRLKKEYYKTMANRNKNNRFGQIPPITRIKVNGADLEEDYAEEKKLVIEWLEDRKYCFSEQLRMNTTAAGTEGMEEELAMFDAAIKLLSK